MGDHYAQRYNYFYRILKEKYPDITFISTLQLSPSRDKLEKADMIDPHWYVNADFFFENDHLFDSMERGKYDIYIGEYAVISEANMNSALAEAAFLTGVERNSDLVKMASYAPLLENVNRKDWPTNLIWYDNEKTMGRASYYVQQMYSANRPTYNIGANISEPTLCLTNGEVGFIGKDISEMVRNITVKDSKGAVIASNIDPRNLFTTEKKSTNRWSGPTHLNMTGASLKDGGTVEFEICLRERELPPLPFSPDPKPRIGITAPSMIFGADKGLDQYFVVNIPTIVGDRQIVTMNRAGGRPNADSNPGGTSLQLGKDQWHKVKVSLDSDNMVAVEIDGKEEFRQMASAPTGHYIASGYDEPTGEIIVKVVNATGETYSPKISINASDVESKGKTLTLKADSKKSENSMQQPELIVPMENEYNGFGKQFKYTFAPNSFTILKLKATK